MKLSCSIAEDLLPLYLDGVCSEDSRAALEEHLKECPSCRAGLARMKTGIAGDARSEKATPQLAGYAKKVRNHRIRVAVSVVLVAVLVSALLALSGLAVLDMRNQASPHVFEVEAGTYNLTAEVLETTAGEVGQYVLFTNSTKIHVAVQGEGSFQGSVMLWNVENDRDFILIADVDEGTNSCTFENLSAANRYRVTCEGLDGAVLTVSEGRLVSFWHSLGTVLGEIAGW